MAEHSAVNRRVVGSSPTCGANIYNELARQECRAFFIFPLLFPLTFRKPHFGSAARSGALGGTGKQNVLSSGKDSCYLNGHERPQCNSGSALYRLDPKLLEEPAF